MNDIWELQWQPCGRDGSDSTLCKIVRFFPKTVNNTIQGFGRLKNPVLRVIVRHRKSGDDIKITFGKQYKVHFPGGPRHLVENGKVRWWENPSDKGGTVSDYPSAPLFMRFAAAKFGEHMASQIMTAFANPK